MGGNFKSRKRNKTALERLDRCHRRLEERLRELVESSAAIASGDASDEHWEVVEEVLAYLERAVVRHEEDEEASVFPRLAQHPRPAAPPRSPSRRSPRPAQVGR